MIKLIQAISIVGLNIILSGLIAFVCDLLLFNKGEQYFRGNGLQSMLDDVFRFIYAAIIFVSSFIIFSILLLGGLL